MQLLHEKVQGFFLSWRGLLNNRTAGTCLYSSMQKMVSFFVVSDGETDLLLSLRSLPFPSFFNCSSWAPPPCPSRVVSAFDLSTSRASGGYGPLSPAQPSLQLPAGAWTPSLPRGPAPSHWQPMAARVRPRPSRRVPSEFGPGRQGWKPCLCC